MLKLLKRARRSRRLLDTSRYIVLSNFLRTGIVDFLRQHPNHTATLDELVQFYFTHGMPAAQDDIALLQQYCAQTETPDKREFIQYLIKNARWLEGRRQDVKFTPPPAETTDWNPVVKALHEKFDPKFPGNDPQQRAAARAHWEKFLVMADAFGIAPYADGRVQLSPAKLAELTEELELFGDGYYGVDDLLGVLLKVEALRGDTSWIVRPPPFMLEACDAVAQRIGIDAYWQFSRRLANGGCRVLDLGCGSGIYSNAFAAKGNECVAVDHTPWVFYRAFLAAGPGVEVICADMNKPPERITRKPFTHVMSNLAAHHFRNRPQLFAKMGELMGADGELCVLNFNYSLNQPSWNPIARLKRQFAAKIQYNWSVLEYDRGGVQFISPDDVAREMESVGFTVTVHPCGLMRELFLVRGLRK